MKVKVKRCEIREGEKKDGTPYIAASAVVIFPDGQSAAQLFIPEEVIDPSDVEVGGIYDLYRDDKGFVLVFEKLEQQPAAPHNN